ncbi:hypothetical protein PQX77_006223 [Marasmius sp. AFHP31]|nr:hypothetical protein PQX77_006223 [Marasmius sp. AFHP31]
MYSPLHLTLIAAVAFLVVRQIDRARRRQASLPPGPKGLPILGNIRDIAKRRDHLWTTYSNWAHRFGDVFHLNVFGEHTIVLNSLESITELLEKRSQNYSDRPGEFYMPMLVGLIGGGWQIAFMRYSDSWRLHRKTFHQSFQVANLPGYYDIQRDAVTDLVGKLSTAPEGFFDHINYFAGSIVLKVIYGYTLKTEDDPYLDMMYKAVEGIVPAMNHGSFWVDYLPILKYVPAWVPGASFKRKAQEWYSNNKDLKEIPWSWVKQGEAAGLAESSFCTQTAERLGITLGEGSEMEDMLKNCAFSAYTAGAETSVSALLTFILAMTLHPEVQARAQKEIESVVGRGALPDFGDKEALPYVNAIIAEVLRWHTVTPLSLPHRAVNDDVYAGYHIPAGATVVGNVWAIMHDENVYGPDVTAFNPDRFMRGDGKNPPHPEQFAFGFGRRVCPGKNFAMNSLYLAMSNILASYTIAKPLDESGNEYDPKLDFTDNGTSIPEPFQCRFIPRSPAKTTVVA